MPEHVEEEPPSYQHALQAGLDENSVVHEFGRFKDTSLDSFERGELFIQAFRSQINGSVPPELVEQVRQHGLQNVQQIDQMMHSNSLFKHPLATANQPPFYITMSGDGHTPVVEFWPRLRHRGDMDWDITLQATHPYLASYGEGDKVHSLHYFEITVEEAKSDVVLSIGLSTKPYPLFRMPGWNNHSIGYHSDDGRKFIDDATGGQDYGPSWKKGDTIGCGYSPTEGNVFFTKNGQMLGIAYSSISPLNYYASLAADGHAKINVNFGTRPFLYYPPPPPPSFSYPPPPA